MIAVMRFFSREGGPFLGYLCILMMLTWVAVLCLSVNAWLSIIPVVLLLTALTTLPTWYRAITSHQALSEAEWAELQTAFCEVEAGHQGGSTANTDP